MSYYDYQILCLESRLWIIMSEPSSVIFGVAMDVVVVVAVILTVIVEVGGWVQCRGISRG